MTLSYEDLFAWQERMGEAATEWEFEPGEREWLIEQVTELVNEEYQSKTLILKLLDNPEVSAELPPVEMLQKHKEAMEARLIWITEKIRERSLLWCEQEDAEDDGEDD